MLKKPDKKQLGWVAFFVIGSFVPMLALMSRREPDDGRLTPLAPANTTASTTAAASASASAPTTASAPASANASASASK